MRLSKLTSFKEIVSIFQRNCMLLIYAKKHDWSVFAHVAYVRKDILQSTCLENTRFSQYQKMQLTFYKSKFNNNVKTQLLHYVIKQAKPFYSHNFNVE